MTSGTAVRNQVQMSPRPTTANSNLRRSVTRIAPYRPFGAGELQIEFARREFVLAAAHENGGGFSSLADVQIVCKGLWGMDLDIDEIRSVTARLVSAGKLSNQGGRFELTAGAGQDLAERVRVSSEVEALAFNEWEQGVRDIAPKLDDTQIGDLRDDLALWLQEIITQHGIEAALLLYPEQERALQLLDEIEKLGLRLPAREGGRRGGRAPKGAVRLYTRPDCRSADAPSEPHDHGVPHVRVHA